MPTGECKFRVSLLYDVPIRKFHPHGCVYNISRALQPREEFCRLQSLGMIKDARGKYEAADLAQRGMPKYRGDREVARKSFKFIALTSR